MHFVNRLLLIKAAAGKSSIENHPASSPNYLTVPHRTTGIEKYTAVVTTIYADYWKTDIKNRILFNSIQQFKKSLNFCLSQSMLRAMF